MKDLIFILLFLPFIYFAFKNPFLGLCGWIWTVMAVPKNMLWGFASDIRLTYILAFVTIISLLINLDPLQRKIKSGLYSLLVIFLIHTAISNMLTLGNPSISWDVWNQFIKAVLLSGLIIKLLTTRNRIETFIFILLVGIGFNIFFEGLKFVVTLGSYKIIGIDNSMMTDNNLFALAVLMVLPLYIFSVQVSSIKIMRLGFIGITALSVISIIGTYSRGGFLGLLVVVISIFKNIKYKFSFVLLSIFFAIIAINIASDKWTSRMNTIEAAQEDKSFLGRVTAWKLATVAAIDNPIFGVGQDSMQNYPVWSFYYNDISMLDFIPTKNVSENHAKAAHSIYFQVLGDSGFVGLVMYVYILLWSLKKSRNLVNKAKNDWVKKLSQSISTTLIVFMLSGALLSIAYYDLLFALISIVISMEKIELTDRKLTN